MKSTLACACLVSLVFRTATFVWDSSWYLLLHRSLERIVNYEPDAPTISLSATGLCRPVFGQSEDQGYPHQRGHYDAQSSILPRLCGDRPRQDGGGFRESQAAPAHPRQDIQVMILQSRDLFLCV